MFDFVRKHNRLMQFLLLLLIFPSFVLFGIEGYSRFRDQGQTVAEVDGQKITQDEWEAAHKAEVERLRANNPKIDTKLLDSPQLRYASLERLIQQRVLAAVATSQRLSVGDARLARELRESPAIAGLRKPDGSLDMERYRQLAAAQGLTPEGFESRVRADLTTRQVVSGVSSSALDAKALADLAMKLYLERREVQLTRYAARDWAAQVKPTEAEIEAYYKEHPREFQSSESADVEYLVLDVDALRKGVTVSEADLKTYYEQNQARLAGQEQRRASHILLTVAKGAPAEEKAKVLAKAQELRTQAVKNPGAFEELARKNSQDPGSAERGGDLDFFARGAMVKPFEEKVFVMAKGDISEPVESEFGYHIIKLTDIKAVKQRSFDDMRPEIEQDVRKQLAQKKFAESAETFANLVYEQSDSLKPAAEKLGLTIRQAKDLHRQAAPDQRGPLANPRLLAALFSTDSIEKKRNTEAVEVGPNQLASGRVTRYTPAATRALADVRDEVRERLIGQRAAELARKAGQAQLDAWKKAGFKGDLKEKLVVSRQDVARLGAPLVEGVLRADASALPAWQGIDLGPVGYAVARIDKLLPPDLAGANTQGFERQYGQAWASAESLAYYEFLKTQLKVKILVPKPAPPESGPAGAGPSELPAS
ncbi:MAG TPA: SurA N-terminal domain-containing protein [Burkholderiaceae bacterium]|nr:SurA N-terminal domain-containing protein [Burkholderiaceae bacterium]